MPVVCVGRAIVITYYDLVWVVESGALHTSGLYIEHQEGVVGLLLVALEHPVLDRSR